MKILTWNLGLFFYYKYYKHFNFTLNGVDVLNEYFQIQYIDFVIAYLKKEQADICFLQELYSKDECDLLRAGLMGIYSYSEIISTQYHNHSILVLSKSKITTREILATEFSYVESFGKNFIPIHLNSFSPKKRFLQIHKLLESSYGKIDFIIGDTNFWSYNNIFLTKNDKKSYRKLLEQFIDVGSYTKITSKMGLNLDRIFLSKDEKIISVNCPHISQKGMDHFPLVLVVK